MSASANLVQNNIAAFNSGDNFMLISNSEANTKKFKNFQSNEIKRIRELSNSSKENCDKLKSDISASNSTSLYQEVGDNIEKTVEKKYTVNNINFQNDYEGIGAPLVKSNEESEDENNYKFEDNSVEENSVEENSVEENSVEDNSVEETISEGNSESLGLVVPNTVEEPYEPIKVHAPVPENNVVETFVEVPPASSLLSLRNLVILVLICVIGYGVYYYIKNKKQVMNIRLNNIYGNEI